MSPRGVATPNVREQLFAAAERVLAREGPAGLTNRAVTAEAGFATGLLYKHFADIDTFIAELVLDRMRQSAQTAAALTDRVGQGTVAANLTDAVTSLLGPQGPAMTAAAMSRPGISGQVRAAMEQGAPSFGAIEASITGYLDQEKDLGRIGADTDTETLALAIVGTLHHLLMTGWAGTPDPAARVRRLIAVLDAGMAPGGGLSSGS
ncbi:MAG: TetR/AcrR family transcriptional regulator [Catenulispora sp.]|nr:TetR/AcrR family transcriptional regulator [Catenulispora sp.]NUR60021.1 TetR/AcrR family transcriptional regulator [Catenulispora sp.]